MNAGMRIQAFVGYFSDMVWIYGANKLINLRFGLGLIGDRRQLLVQYLLLKETRKANLRLMHYGFKRKEVYTREHGLLIRKCRKDILRYIRHCRRTEK